MTSSDDLHDIQLAVHSQKYPHSFECPISRELMHDPVMLTDGHSYERRHIEAWLKSHDTSPVSGATLQQKTVLPNHALRNAIDEYFQQVFSLQRQAICNTLSQEAWQESRMDANAALLRTVDALMHSSVLVNADFSAECILRRIMDQAKSLVGAEVASVFLVDRARKELYSTVNSTGAEIRIPIAAGIAGHVAATGEALLIADAYQDDRFNKTVDLQTGFRTHSILCVPIKSKQMGVIGVAQLINKTSTGVLAINSPNDATATSSGGLSFSSDDMQFLQVFASQAAAAVTTNATWNDVEALSEDQGSQSRSNSKATIQSISPKSKAQSKSTSKGNSKGITFFGDDSADEVNVGEVERWLDESFTSWQVDTLYLAEITDNRPLSTLGTYLFEKHGFVGHFGIDTEKLRSFFEAIEEGYSDSNPYHNRAHAASVLHMTNAILFQGKVADALSKIPCHTQCCSRLEQMSVLLAAAVHDYQHDGVTNDFLVKTHSERALLYDDEHPNENHHLAASLSVMRRPENNFLDQLPPKDLSHVQEVMTSLVLATDMASNVEIVNAFKKVLPSEGSEVVDELFPKSMEEADIGLQMLLKCADLGHLALDWATHEKWVARLEKEFFAQGDREKTLGFPSISFLMDRDKPGVSESQVGFFNFVVLPMFRSFSTAFPHARPMLEAVESNFQRWSVLEQSSSN